MDSLGFEKREGLGVYEESFNQLNFERSLPARWTLMSLRPTGFDPAWGPAPGIESPAFGFYGTLPKGEGETRAVALFEGGSLRVPFTLSVWVRKGSAESFGLVFSFRSKSDFRIVERDASSLRIWGRRLGETLFLGQKGLPRITDKWHHLQLQRRRGWVQVRWDHRWTLRVKTQGSGQGLMGLYARGGSVAFENLRLVQGK